VTSLSFASMREPKRTYSPKNNQPKAQPRTDLFYKHCKLKNHIVENCLHLEKPLVVLVKNTNMLAKNAITRDKKGKIMLITRGVKRKTLIKGTTRRRLTKQIKIKEIIYVTFATIEKE
jgi:hypothetical protein